MIALVSKPVIYALAGALLASLIFGGTQCSQKQAARTDAAKARTELAEQTASIAIEREAFVTQARAVEQRHTAEMSRIAEQEQERLNREKADHDRLVADLRAGTVRLHNRWQAALATSRLSATVGAASQPDAAERERQDSAARIVRAAQRCDAQVKGLQEVVRSMTAATSGNTAR